MKKFLLITFFVFTFFLQLVCVPPPAAHAQTPGVNLGTPQPPDGAWLSDDEVTFTGKNAARAKDLFNWVLVNYQWSTNDSTLISFWAKIRNVVFVFLIILVMVSAFLMVISGGQSLTAMQFIRKFLVVIVLITFSFAFIRIFYQIVDVIQSFFIKNPDGQIISSKDLLNISFGYIEFTGYRRFGPEYNEAAFISLLLTKITAATYFVMAGVLIIRKVILWFFITVSPIYPVLLMYFPIRNTAKIWIGEFFRWLLYAPLFAIFLSGLVVLWRDNINVLPFHFTATGTQPNIVYPTAINILLGGPGQRLAIDNNINYTDTFAEYIVALIMLWVVIFLPFLLLRIFLDYLSNVNVNNNPAWKYITSNANKIIPSNDFFFNNKQTSPTTPPPPPPSYRPTGTARALPFPTGDARTIPVARPVAQAMRPVAQTVQTYTTQSNQTVRQVPMYKSEKTSVATSQLVNFSIPTMRDVARYETSRLSSQISSHQEISKVHETLQKIASPQSITNPVERQQFNTIREKLVQSQKQGEPLATSILNAANTVTNKSSRTNITNISNVTQTSNVSQVTNQATTQVQQAIQKLANPASVTNVTERQQITSLTGKLTQISQLGNSAATSVLHTINNFTKQNSQQTNTQIKEIVEKLANTSSITNVKERQQVNQLKEQLTKEKEQGNPIATSILAAVDKVQQANQTTQTVLPATNQVQTVNLEDYEEVKKTWTENYRSTQVPKTLDKPDRTREEWIKEDLTNTTHAIDLLGSQDQQKVQEGMNEVSSLLPFLLLGGFSQTEIVAYLQAKKHAAEEVLASTTQNKQEEEDTLLDARTKHTQASLHMQESLSNVTNVSNNSEETNNDEDNPLYQITHTTNNTIQNIQSSPALKNTMSTQTMQLVNFSIPTMKDVARYEAAKINPQNTEKTNEEQMHEMLQKLANPDSITDQKERETYTVMKQQLEQAKTKGDPLAVSILSTAEKLALTTQEGKGQASHLTSATLPKENPVQTVNLEDYEEVRKTWKENYETLPVPKSIENPELSREEWIQGDVTKTTDAINLLTSGDPEKKKEGMELVAALLPFLLLGGFSETEVISYLQAKKHAGEEVLKDVKEKNAEEETLVDANKKEKKEGDKSEEAHLDKNEEK